MRVLVTGAKGMLGQDVVLELTRRGIENVAFDREELDLLNPRDLELFAGGTHGKFDWVVNCAAYTAVDKAETEPLQAHRLNAAAPGALAHACGVHGARLTHVSTDFVFDGRATSPYTESAPTNPLGVYGQSKKSGEDEVLKALPTSLVCRTAWLFGPLGKSFPLTMVRAWLAGKQLRVVADQLGSPTYTVDLARVLIDLVVLGPEGGLYHTAGPDVLNWHDLAMRAITAYRDLHGIDRPMEVEPIKTSDWPTPTPRPAYSALSFAKCQVLGIAPMRSMDEAVPEFVHRLGDLEVS